MGTRPGAYDWSRYEARKREEKVPQVHAKKGLELLRERDEEKSAAAVVRETSSLRRTLYACVVSAAAVTGLIALSVGTGVATFYGGKTYLAKKEQRAQEEEKSRALAESLRALADTFPHDHYLDSELPNSFVYVTTPERPTRLLICLDDPDADTIALVKYHLAHHGVKWESALDGDGGASVEKDVEGVALRSPSVQADFQTLHQNREIVPSSPTGEKRRLFDLLGGMQGAVQSEDPHHQQYVSVLIRRSNDYNQETGKVFDELYNHPERNNERYAVVRLGPDRYGRNAKREEKEALIAAGLYSERSEPIARPPSFSETYALGIHADFVDALAPVPRRGESVASAIVAATRFDHPVVAKSVPLVSQVAVDETSQFEHLKREEIHDPMDP